MIFFMQYYTQVQYVYVFLCTMHYSFGMPAYIMPDKQESRDKTEVTMPNAGLTALKANVNLLSEER